MNCTRYIFDFYARKPRSKLYFFKEYKMEVQFKFNKVNVNKFSLKLTLKMNHLKSIFEFYKTYQYYILLNITEKF